MVATSILFDLGLAHGAERDIVFVSGRPLSQLLVHCLLASDLVSVPYISALEAHFCAALVARQLCCIVVLCTQTLSTRWFRTVSAKWVIIKSLLLFEALKLLSQFDSVSICKDLLDLLN